ncbi:hypothetical protein BpHYR1_004304 [Brachionus plicatilis]|uniref:Uncharacterized protein n=1 Tax=Brachionus plicatilis TaxID=10195 RepID=A0A3M7QTA2_BRAPC|nr:hypothetical protein BpHYR1_004304 [Brachionus plicatilis]
MHKKERFCRRKFLIQKVWLNSLCTIWFGEFKSFGIYALKLEFKVIVPIKQRQASLHRRSTRRSPLVAHYQIKGKLQK